MCALLAIAIADNNNLWNKPAWCQYNIIVVLIYTYNIYSGIYIFILYI